MKRYGRFAGNPGVCRHCHKAVAWRPRQLCWACFYTPQVRDLYRPMSCAESGRLGGKSGVGAVKSRTGKTKITTTTGR